MIDKKQQVEQTIQEIRNLGAAGDFVRAMEPDKRAIAGLALILIELRKMNQYLHALTLHG